MLTATELLAIPLVSPERLFTGDSDRDKELFRTLQHQWHPDRGGTEEVFKHVSALFAALKEQLAAGTWRGTGKILLGLPAGQALKLNYLRWRPFELGAMFILKSGVVFVSNGTDISCQLFARATKTIQALKYADDKMRTEFARYMPVIKSYIPVCTLNGATGPAIVIEKAPELVALRDLFEYQEGKLDPKHVAWMLTRLHSLTCYLQWAGLTHNDIDLDTCFISPEQHTVCLLGGWWYATPRKEPLKYLPARSASLWRTLPLAVTQGKQARHALDRSSIRQLGRELLGDVGASKLLHDPSIPKALATWVSVPAGQSAFEDFKQWEFAREKSFGPRKFTKLAVDADTIYAPSGA